MHVAKVLTYPERVSILIKRAPDTNNNNNYCFPAENSFNEIPGFML